MSTIVKVVVGVLLSMVILAILAVGCTALIASNAPPNDSAESTDRTAPTQREASDTNVQLEVTEVQNNYPSPNQFSQPDEGNEFILVGATITNGGNRDLSVIEMEFKLRDAGGVARRANPVPTSDIPGMMKSVTLSPGASTSGNLLFEAPKGEASLMLVFEQIGGRETTAKVR